MRNQHTRKFRVQILPAEISENLKIQNSPALTQNIIQSENVSYFVLPVLFFVKRQFYYLMKPLPLSMVIRIQTFNQYCEMNFHQRHFLRLPIG